MDYDFIEHLVHKNLGMVREQFPKLFGERAYPMVTECMVQAAKQEPACDRAVVKLMASFERAPCGHQGRLRSAEDCLRECFAEPRYCLAGRSKWSMKLAYYFPHVLVMMWDPANVLVLRAPSDDAKAAVESQMDRKRFHADNLERKLTKDAINEEKRERVEKNKALSAKIAYNMRYHRKPVAKGPNPLSMLKPMSEAKKRGRSPFMQFGGATPNGENPFEDPSYMSRSKMRKKRKRVEEATEKALKREAEGKSTPEAPEQNKLIPTASDDASTPSAQKTRKRRKPKTLQAPSGDEPTHQFREKEFERDSKIEAATPSE